MPSVNSSSRPNGLALLDVHDAVLADLLDRVRDHVADLALARRDAGDPGDVLLARDLLGLRLQVLDDRVDGLLDAALERHRVRAGGDVLQALADDRLASTVAVVVPSPATSFVAVATSRRAARPGSRTRPRPRSRARS
jgi:hypothetical protein